jgi:transcriptional regulator GlxA family with amidase domain
VDSRIEIALALIKLDVRRAPRAHQMADQIGLSVSHFYDLFRKETGTGPAAYIRRLRFERARDLLSSSRMSVKEITHMVGVDDVSHFVRDFKRFYGMSPRNYRRFGPIMRGVTTPSVIGDNRTSGAFVKTPLFEENSL